MTRMGMRENSRELSGWKGVGEGVGSGWKGVGEGVGVDGRV